MIIEKRELWGREFKLEVIYDHFDDEQVLPEQLKAFKDFKSHWEAAESALPALKAFIEKEYAFDLQGRVVDNIFKFVIPKTIYVPRDQDPETVELLCDFRFDIEHGLTLVFKDGKLQPIVPGGDF
jgi:hypothetical protein